MSLNRQQRLLLVFCACLALQFVGCLGSPPKFRDDEPGDGEDNDPDNEDNNGLEIELGTGAIVGIVIGIVALLIAIPILLCFCCGCCCFKEKKQHIIGVTPSATLRRQHPSEKPPAEIASEPSQNPRLSLNTPSPSRRDSQFSSATAPSAPEFRPYPLDDNLGTFYYNLGYEPPPPFPFNEDHYGPDGIQVRYSDAAWATSRNGESRAGSARPSMEASKLGPSLISKGRLG